MIIRDKERSTAPKAQQFQHEALRCICGDCSFGGLTNGELVNTDDPAPRQEIIVDRMRERPIQAQGDIASYLAHLCHPSHEGFIARGHQVNNRPTIAGDDL